MMPKKIFFIIILFISSNLICESFGNNKLVIPKLGMAFFDTPILIRKKNWGITRQYTIGIRYAQAINYNWWWIVDSRFGLGSMNINQKLYLPAVMGGGGVRYNFLDDDFRPYISLFVHYLQFLGKNTSLMPLDSGWPIWVGLMPEFGLEYVFYPELSFSLNAAYGFYININEPFRHILLADLAFSLYF